MKCMWMRLWKGEAHMEWLSLISIRAALNALMLGFDNDFDDGFSLEGRVCLVFKKIEEKKI